MLMFLTASWGQVKSIGMPSNSAAGSMPAATSASTMPSTPPDSSDSGNAVLGVEYHTDVPDSVLQSSVFMFQRPSGRVKIMAVDHPALTHTGSQFHDPLDGFNGDYYLSVSELGHPHYSVFPDFNTTPGIRYRRNLYPGFYKTADNITYYQAQTPYAVLSYSSSLDEAYQLHVTHTQNINSHWNYALDYHLFNPSGSFSNSSASNNLLDFNTNYYSPDARYQLAAAVIWQRMLLGENGGLANPSSYRNKNFRNTAGIPIVNTLDMSNSNDITVVVRQSYNMVRQFEWYRPIKEQYIDTATDSSTVTVAYFDSVTMDSVGRDSTVYTRRPVLVDTIVGYDTLQPNAPKIYNAGVLALELQWDRQKYRYTAADSSCYNRLATSLFWTNDAYMDRRWHNALKLTGGIRPQADWLRLNPAIYSDTLLHRVAFYPFAQVEIRPWDFAELTVYGEASPNLSEYNLDAVLLLPFRDTAGESRQSLRLHAAARAYRPELIYYAQCLNAAHPTDIALSATGVRKIEADYRLKDRLDIHLAASHISNNIWFEPATSSDGSTTYRPAQADGSALLLQGRMNLYLKPCGWLRIDMQHHLQYSSDQGQIRVPAFATKNSIYTDFKVFRRAMSLQVGFDVRYHTRFFADGYDPALGIFYRQNSEPVGNYLWADFFVNIQIKRATIYLKAGHFNTFLEQNAYCVIPNYPARQFGLFYGITWKFFD